MKTKTERVGAPGLYGSTQTRRWPPEELESSWQQHAGRFVRHIKPACARANRTQQPLEGPVTRRSLTLLGGLSYVVAVVQYFAAQLYAAAAWNPPYDWSGDYISDLGNTACAMFAVPRGTPAYVCSPHHAVMNGAFVASGVLLITGTIALWRFWPARAATRIALALLLISGCGKMLVGWVPENGNIVLHSIGAFNMPVASVAILLISATLLHARRALAIIGLAAFVLGVIGTTLSVVAQFAGSSFLLGLGVGGMERLAGYPANAWLLAAGLTTVAEVARSRSR